MRVLTLICDLAPGGTQRVAQNYAIQYLLRGHESAVMTWQGGGPREAPLRDAGVRLFIAGDSDASRAEALRLAIDWAPDVVHVHRTGHTHALSASLLKALRARVKRRASGAPIGVLETNVFARVDYSRDRGCIDLHMQLSRWCLWKWNRWASILRPRPLGVLLPYMVDERAFSPLSAGERAEFRQRHGIPGDALLIGRVGSPSMAKWHPLLLSAFSRYAAENPAAWLVVVGLPPELRAAIAGLPEGVRRRITDIPFLHGDPALREVYSAMDIFLHAALIGESFGMVLTEAMLCRTPVITLATPARDNSQGEVVGHEVGGLVVASEEGALEALRRLAAPAVREQLGDAARRRVLEMFTPDAVMPRLIELAGLVSRGLDRSALKREVRANPRLVTSVPRGEIASARRAVLGSHPLKERALFHLVANPVLYRLYSARKGPA